MVINSVAFKKKHGIPVKEGLSIDEIAKLSKMKIFVRILYISIQENI